MNLLIANPLKLWRGFQERISLDRIVLSALNGLALPINFYDCNTLSEVLRDALKTNGIKAKRFFITSNPPEYELGHVYYPNQFGHEVIEVEGEILDPFYPRMLPLEEYLKRAYRPKNNVQIVAHELDEGGKIVDYQ